MVELVFILDRSGSMTGLQKESIKGFNKVLNDQKKVSENAIVTTVLFNDKINFKHDRVSIKNVNNLTEREYHPDGYTALLDAVGMTIKHIVNAHKKFKKEYVPKKTLFVIITDGFENSSRYYSYNDVKRMIHHEQKHHEWEFIFLGANIDAVKEASKIGIDKEMAVDYKPDKIGTQLNYDVINDTITNYRNSSGKISSQWNKRIKEDYKNRSI